MSVPIVDRVAQQLAAASVAAAAGISAIVWADAARPRIFHQRGVGFMGGRNRGRLPFIEFDLGQFDFSQESRQGGTVEVPVRLLIHVGGNDPGAAAVLATQIAQAALAAVQDETVDNLMSANDGAQIGELERGPWGHQMQASVIIVQSYDDPTMAISV